MFALPHAVREANKMEMKETRSACVTHRALSHVRGMTNRRSAAMNERNTIGYFKSRGSFLRDRN
jgi:hypothetical protein